MTPPSLRELFAASAGVAGALIGLLFVAVSVAHERLTAENADQVHRVRAVAALTAFSNALVVSLFALIPDVGLGGTCSVVSVLGLGFVVGSLLSILRAREVQPVAVRDTVFLAGLVVIFSLQLDFALRLLSRGNDVGAARGIAILVIACFIVGIARSWELIGGPSIGLLSEMAWLVRRPPNQEPFARRGPTSEDGAPESAESAPAADASSGH